MQHLLEICILLIFFLFNSCMFNAQKPVSKLSYSVYLEQKCQSRQ